MLHNLPGCVRAPRRPLCGAPPDVPGGKSSPARPGQCPARPRPAHGRLRSAQCRRGSIPTPAGQSGDVVRGRAPSSGCVRWLSAGNLQHAKLHPFGLSGRPAPGLPIRCRQRCAQRNPARGLFLPPAACRRKQSAPRGCAAHRPLRQTLPAGVRLFQALNGKTRPPDRRSHLWQRARPPGWAQPDPGRQYASRPIRPDAENCLPLPHEHIPPVLQQRSFFS